tara:strand:- start:305 stop:613 length:309 start_codon:yes stop_codon:yes gene_type:complete
MAVTYTWTIPTVERNLSDGGITIIHWRCTGVDGDNSASSYGTTGHEPDASADGFIAYDSVTEANCIAWAQAALDKDATEAALAAQIEADKNPTSGAGTPWAA